MKIRSDFVTNSSSSSFILAFKSEKTIPEELLKGFPPEYKKEFGRIWNDVTEAERLTAEEVVNSIKDYISWEAEYDVEVKYCKRHSCSYKEAKKYIDSPAGQEEIKKKIDKVIEQIKKEINGKSVIVEVEYGDHEYPDLEHEVMPQLKSSIFRISHH